MAIVASFTVSQSAIVPENIVVTDSSTGDYDTITKRRVYVQNAYGEYLTGDGSVDYDEWALVDTSITLDVLTQDTAANIKVEWLTAGNVVVDTENDNYPLSQFGKQFFFYLIQLQGLTPGVYQDTNYSGNLAIFWSNIVGGDNAVTYGNDIAGAQNCYNREIQMQQNESLYF
jgi:hypothetical protein